MNENRIINIPAKAVPIMAQADVVVCGGGPAGIAAAVSAARKGAEVILLERWATVGGQATNAMVNIWHTSDREKQVIFGLVEEILQRGGKYIHRLGNFPKTHETHEFDPAAMKIIFYDILAEAGVKVYCAVPVIESIVENGSIKAVLVDTKTGRKAVVGKFFIDATGDGDVAANAGVPFEFGRDVDGLVQGMTMIFRLCGIETTASSGKADEVFEKMKKLRDAGKFPPFMEEAARSYLRNPRPHTVSYNMCPVNGNPLDELELTKLTMKAARQVYDYTEFWQQNMPEFENCEVEQLASYLGIRESRRIKGIKTFTENMVLNAAKQPDALGHGFWMIDIHDPKGSGHTTWCDREENKKISLAPGESYHIPLGMCLNDVIDNLAVVGRCASATHAGLASIRLQTHCMVMGQGVGTAAALALDAGITMKELDIVHLQDTLRTDGVYIRDIPSMKVGE